ncbi:MAG: decaprenyl-phosphate phosphoribosyltransferase [bacterium]|nr:decaprenyl-phosphate phosphoribosyltransferase [bacterium]
MIGPLFRAMRPVQWVKNVFVLAPIVFAEQLRDPQVLGRAAIAFAAFCLAASTVYLINDLRDREEDRRHPLKRHRPIASGALSVPVAVTAAVILAAAALAASFTLGTRFTVLVAVYLGINLLYSSFLKHVVILDVMAVASGYVIRVLAGAEAIGVGVSAWLLLCTIFLALFLILSKRRHELVLLADAAAGHRSVLSHYSPAFLDQMINVVTASTVVSYALYAVDADTVARFGTDRLVYTVPLVLFGIFRFLYLIYKKEEKHNPTEAVLRDVPSVINVLLWGVLVLWLVYG